MKYVIISIQVNSLMTFLAVQFVIEKLIKRDFELRKKYVRRM